MRFWPGVWVFTMAVLPCLLRAQEDSVERAVKVLQSGDLAGAEQILRGELRSHPGDEPALEVMGAVLDQEKKFGEAEQLYRKALAIAPRSAGLLNNYGNHLVTTGKPKEAHAAFLKVLATDPTHANALVQLARMALELKAPAEANRYLERLPAAMRGQPAVELLRLRAYYGLHRENEARALVARLAEASGSEAERYFALAQALAAAGEHAQAETFFARTLELAPDRFDALYDLGLAASHAGHSERARAVLEQALLKQPDNVDVMCDLAVVDAETNNGAAGLALLARARALAPERADVEQLLARTAAQLGYFADAAEAWDAYLKQRPDDEIARREHAFVEMAVPENTRAALADLEAFAKKRPEDATGHYELGAAWAATDPERALAETDRALARKPDFAAAHLMRGLLLYRRGKPELAVTDFEKAAGEDRENATILERLGQTYLALNRTDDALPVLRRAEQMAPRSAGVLLQLGRALAKSGDSGAAEAVFARYRELGTTQQGGANPAGLVDFLSLSPDEQFARYRAGVERTVEKSPGNAEAQVRYLGLLLHDGKTEEAAAVSRRIVTLRPKPSLVEDAVRQLLAAGQYQIAREVAAKAMAESARGPGSGELDLDFALAVEHTDGAAAALEALNKVPQGSRTGDYHLARAECLAAAKRPEEAEQALAAAFRANAKRADLYRSGALLLLEQDQTGEALRVLDKAVENVPDSAELRVLRAVATALEGKAPDARNVDSAFRAIEDRWPESSLTWEANAFVLEAEGRPEAARMALKTAKDLGAVGAAVTRCEEELASGPADAEERHKRLLEALALLFG